MKTLKTNNEALLELRAAALKMKADFASHEPKPWSFTMTIKNFLKITIAILLITGLTACARNPLGIPDEQWETMTTQEQMEARAKQEEINTQRRIARERERVLAEIREQELAAQRADNLFYAADSDVLQCIYRGGSHEPHGFELLRGERLEVFLTRKSGSTTRIENLLVTFDGMNLSACSGGNCQRTAATSRDYANGVQVQLTDRVQGALVCQTRGSGRQWR